MVASSQRQYEKASSRPTMTPCRARRELALGLADVGGAPAGRDHENCGAFSVSEVGRPGALPFGQSPHRQSRRRTRSSLFVRVDDGSWVDLACAAGDCLVRRGSCIAIGARARHRSPARLRHFQGPPTGLPPRYVRHKLALLGSMEE